MNAIDTTLRHRDRSRSPLFTIDGVDAACRAAGQVLIELRSLRDALEAAEDIGVAPAPDVDAIDAAVVALLKRVQPELVKAAHAAVTQAQLAASVEGIPMPLAVRELEAAIGRRA